MMPERGTNEGIEQVAVPPPESSQLAHPSQTQGDWQRYARIRRRSRILSVFYVLVALSTGLTLIVAPWQDQWSFNYLQEVSPSVETIWHDPSFRGAISGLGFANLLIALIETVRLLRRS
jgi:hypothetical protein